MCMSVLSTYQDFLKIFVGDVGELGSVVFGDHELWFGGGMLAWFDFLVSWVRLLGRGGVEVMGFIEGLVLKCWGGICGYSVGFEGLSTASLDVGSKEVVVRGSYSSWRGICHSRKKGSTLTACPRLRGWISRKAKTLSLSKSLKEGISPIVYVGLAGSDHCYQWAQLENKEYSICRCAEVGGTVPLMILQKMQAAEDILCDEVEYIR